MCPWLPSAKALGQCRLQDGAVDVSEDLLSSQGEGAAPPIPCLAENPRRARGRASQPRAGTGALTGAVAQGGRGELEGGVPQAW